MKGWLDKYQKGGSVNERMDNEIVGFLKNLITPEVTRSDAPARITTAPKDQSLNSKMWDVVSHPVTAFKHLVNEGRLPNNFAAASPLGIDTALDITGLNPLGYASLFHDMGASTLNLVTGKGSLGDLITLPVTGLAMLPGAKTAANIVGRHMASNSNFYSPIFNTIEKGANKIGSKVKQVDQKLGEKIFTNKDNLPQVRDIDPSDLESSINYNLKKGLGIKKIDLPMSVTVTKNTSSGNNFNIGNILDGQRTGSVTLEQNLNPFKKQSLSRGVIDAIYPKGNAWANTPGFKKLSDFPFSNIESGNSAITYSGSDYNYNDLINSGVSGELNKAINETLKANNLGNIISGGTGHSTLGKKRWDNLVSKGHAENLGPGKYKLKENGGWLDKYEDGGEINYNDSNASAGPGFQGDGYSNVGRNYSPAWGGQFQKGGKVKPITVTDKNDPRLKAYQDSLSLYNLSNRLMRKATPYAPNYSFPANPILYEDYYVPYNSTGRYPDGNRSKLGLTKQENARGIDFRKEVEKSLKTKNKPLGWAYGDVAVPVYKKPTQPIMYRPEPTPQSIIDFMEGNYAQEPITEIPQASAYGEVVDPRTGYTHMTRQGSPMYPMVGQNVPEMAMGGSLPGATGSMYARVGAPSKGKGRNKVYKTDASAENGKEMKFYQEGLDFKPKSISKNGSKVIKDDRGQWAHPGEITEIGSNQITMRGVPYPVMGISDTGDMQMMYPDEDYVYDGESVTEIPMMREGGTISKKTLARNQRIAESNAAQNQPLTPESLATRAIAIPDKLRLSEQMRNISPDLASWMEENPTMSYIDENLNPLVIAGKLASKLGQVPLNVKQGNYRQALLNTISPMLVRASATGAVTTENLSKSKNKFEQGGQLTKLDQLTNFTNYNTKQPGGWLDKYQ